MPFPGIYPEKLSKDRHIYMPKKKCFYYELLLLISRKKLNVQQQRRLDGLPCDGLAGAIKNILEIAVATERNAYNIFLGLRSNK